MRWEEQIKYTYISPPFHSDTLRFVPPPSSSSSSSPSPSPSPSSLSQSSAGSGLFSQGKQRYSPVNSLNLDIMHQLNLKPLHVISPSVLGADSYRNTKGVTAFDWVTLIYYTGVTRVLPKRPIIFFSSLRFFLFSPVSFFLSCRFPLAKPRLSGLL